MPYSLLSLAQLASGALTPASPEATSALLPYFAGGFAVLASLVIGIVIRAFNGQKESNKDVLSTLGRHGEAFVRIETVLMGPNGDNGIHGEVRHLRARMDDIDRRLGPDDRRAAERGPDRRVAS